MILIVYSLWINSHIAHSWLSNCLLIVKEQGEIKGKALLLLLFLDVCARSGRRVVKTCWKSPFKMGLRLPGPFYPGQGVSSWLFTGRR